MSKKKKIKKLKKQRDYWFNQYIKMRDQYLYDMAKSIGWSEAINQELKKLTER